MNEENQEYFVERNTKFESDEDYLVKLASTELKIVTRLTKSLQANKEYVFENVMEKAYNVIEMNHKRMYAATAFYELMVMASRNEAEFIYKERNEQ